MSTDQKKKTEEENFPFIQEQILSKRKTRVRRALISVIKTVILAIIFGTISSLVICLTGPFFNEIFGKGRGKKPSIVLTTPSPKPTPAPTPLQTAPRNTPKVVEMPKESPQPEQAKPTAGATLEDYSQIASLLAQTGGEVNKSIVTVSGVVSGTDLFNNPSETADSTYGLIIDDDEEELLILTSLRRLEQASSVRVTFADGSICEAAVYGYDKEIGIAIISVETSGIAQSAKETFQSAALGDSYYLTAGMPIIALGSPNGYLYSMIPGVISGKPYVKYITDSKLELFNTNVCSNDSGEGVISNMKGEIVGIITQDFEEPVDEAYSKAIGISKIKTVIEKIVNQETRTYFGIVASDMSSEYAARVPVENGIFVTDVLAKSPAFNAGLQSGDIITKFGDEMILSVQGFSGVLDECMEKDKVNVTVVRTSSKEKPTLELEAVVGKLDCGQN